MKVLISGKTSFKMEVPYRLYQTGPDEAKPMIVYLHGMGHNIEIFERLTKSLHSLDAYHLYIQGPYPDLVNMKQGKNFGYSWYLYNGEQRLLLNSLEYSSEFIQEIIDGIVPHIKISRLCVLGYSMGGYLAGYFGLSRWKHTNELISISARIKAEAFETQWDNRKHINVLAIHGNADDHVEPNRQQEMIDFLKSKGLNALFKEIKGEHILTLPYLKVAKQWLEQLGYNPIGKK